MLNRLAAARIFSRRAWRLASPYWGSEERWRARVLLTVIVALTLALVGLQVLYNDWNRRFFEALQNKDFPAFFPLLLNFGILATLYIVGAVYKSYFTLMLQMRWRVWMTRRYLERWLRDQAYYRLEVADGRTDNPDQRIAEDLRMFTSATLSLSLGALSSLVTLVSFVAILWAISGPLAIDYGPIDIVIPGYMVWVAVLYAAVGSILTHLVGRPLIRLNFLEQRYEADFRFGLVRLRENAEGIALYHGEAVEETNLLGRFESIRANWWQLMHYTKSLTFLTVGYDQLASVFPLLVAAPRYFTGEISLGVLTQIANAFGQVQGALSWFVESYGDLAGWKATVDRLLTFQEALELARTERTRTRGIQVEPNGVGDVVAEHLQVALPDGRVLLPDTNLTIEPGDRILITGPTGSGKSTLFRALAGIWPFGEGRVQVPEKARLLFLPQRPYMPVASLREAIAYPAPGDTFDTAALTEALQATGMGDFSDRLDDVQNWSQQLSGGEQQRIAVARALLHSPEWLFLDEATSAVDEASEADLYTLLRERLPNAAIVSIAHRPRVGEFHETQFSLTADAGGTALTRV